MGTMMKFLSFFFKCTLILCQSQLPEHSSSVFSQLVQSSFLTLYTQY